MFYRPCAAVPPNTTSPKSKPLFLSSITILAKLAQGHKGKEGNEGGRGRNLVKMILGGINRTIFKIG